MRTAKLMLGQYQSLASVSSFAPRTDCIHLPVNIQGVLTSTALLIQ